jgi:hypothetical protein
MYKAFIFILTRGCCGGLQMHSADSIILSLALLFFNNIEGIKRNLSFGVKRSLVLKTKHVDLNYWTNMKFESGGKFQSRL